MCKRLHIAYFSYKGILKKFIFKITCAGLVLGSALKSHTQIVRPQFCTQSVPEMPVVRLTRTSSFSKSNRGKNKLIGILYRPPPPGKSVDGFIEDITNLFSDDCMNRYECYIMGDFNFDMLKMSQNTKIDAFIIPNRGKNKLIGILYRPPPPPPANRLMVLLKI